MFRRRVVVAFAAGALGAGTLVAPSSPVAAATEVRGGCGWHSGLARANTAEDIRAGRLKLGGYGRTTVDLRGDVDWDADPYADPTWRVWFHSLKWAESLLTSGRPGDLRLARRIVASFAAARPDPGLNAGAWKDHPTAVRTSLLVCLWQRGDAGLRRWLRPILAGHAHALRTRYVGASNHGTMQSLALLAVGCLRDVPLWRELAADRLAAELVAAVDDEGAINEQAPGYAFLVWNLHTQAAVHLRACGLQPPRGHGARLSRVDAFVAHASRPDGTLVELGDTWPRRPRARMGPHSAWVATDGARGVPPPATTAVYRSGYVFGRDSWMRPRQHYTLRFGPGRLLHGHNDHLSLTYWAQGREVLVDAGFAGFAQRSYRSWSLSPAAHNVPVIPGVPFRADRSTRLLDHGRRADGGIHTWQLRDRAYRGVERHRSVLVDDEVGLVLVRDDTTGRRPHPLRVLWHLDPAWRREAVSRGTRVQRATFRSPDGGLRAWVVQVAEPGRRLPRQATVAIRGQTRPVQGFVSRARNSREKAWVIEARRGRARAHSVLTVIVVTPGTATAAVTRTRAGTEERVTVTEGETRRTYHSERRSGLGPR